MKITHTADLHIYDKHKYSIDGSRLKEIEDNLYRIVDNSIKHKIKILVVVGDIFHNHNPTEYLMKIFAKFVNYAIKNNIMVRVVIGNHDTDGVVTSLDSISEFIESSVTDSYKEQGNYGMFAIFGGDTYFHEVIDNVKIFYVPQSANMIWNIKEARKVQSKTSWNILFTHGSCAGAYTDTGYQLNDKPEKMDLRPKDLIGWDYVGLGDFHMFQRIGNDSYKKNNKVFYSGSPIKFTWGEREHQKCFIIINATGESIKVGRIRLPDIQLIQLDVEIDDLNSIMNSDDLDVENSFIKMFVYKKGDQADANNKIYKTREHLIKKGARDVYPIIKTYKTNDEKSNEEDVDLDFESACRSQLERDKVQNQNEYLSYLHNLQEKIK